MLYVLCTDVSSHPSLSYILYKPCFVHMSCKTSSHICRKNRDRSIFHMNCISCSAARCTNYITSLRKICKIQQLSHIQSIPTPADKSNNPSVGWIVRDHCIADTKL